MSLRKNIKQKATAMNKRMKKQHKAVFGFVALAIVVSTIAFGSLTKEVASEAPAVAGYPAPTDAVETQYGSIGKWMLKSNGQVADYGGQLYQDKTLIEAINVVIVDPTSKSESESKKKINKAMSAAGFPARIGHSVGFKGLISGKTYSQLPSGLISAYSDASFLAQNNHGRLFGPAPVTTGGYVYSGGFSTEKFAIYKWRPAHVYVSSNAARDALAQKLVSSGQVQTVNIDLMNAYNTDTTTTGDHDSKAAVIVLK
jgi:hypothetical protein